MGQESIAQTFLFTFRPNEVAEGEPLVEVFVEELADYDPSPAEDSVKCSWFGKEDAMVSMLENLGFEQFDIRGVVGALNDHRNADRRLAITLEQLHKAGFRDAPKER